MCYKIEREVYCDTCKEITTQYNVPDRPHFGEIARVKPFCTKCKTYGPTTVFK